MSYTQEQRRAHYATDAYRKTHRAWARRDRAKKKKAYRRREIKRAATSRRRQWKATYYVTVERPKSKMREGQPKRKAYKRRLDAKPRHKKRRLSYSRSPKAKMGVLGRLIKRAGRPKPRDSRCEKCRKKRKLRFDHDHKTGRFRGWICNGCNTGLGNMGDTVEGLLEGIAYLRGELPWQRKNRS